MRRLQPGTGRELPPEHPSRELCAELAGAPTLGQGNVGDLADLIAQYLENSESPPRHRAPVAPTAKEAKGAVVLIMNVLSRATARIVELEHAGDPVPGELGSSGSKNDNTDPYSDLK